MPTSLSTLPRPSDRARIRRLFLRARPWYGLGEAAGLLAMTVDEVRRAIEDGVIEAVDFDGELRIAWQEVVVLGMLQRWTPRIISTALPPQQVPPLARSARRPVHLPRYLWDLLALLARERSTNEDRELTISDLVEEALHHAVLADLESAEEMERQIPGIRKTAAWPLTRDT